MNQKLANAIPIFLRSTSMAPWTSKRISDSFYSGGKEAAKIAFDYDRQSFDDEKVSKFENDFADWLQKQSYSLNHLPAISPQMFKALQEYYENHPEYRYSSPNTPDAAGWAELGAILVFRALREHLSEKYTTLELDSYEAGIADTIKIKA